MDSNIGDIHEDSGRYLQEYIQSKVHKLLTSQRPYKTKLWIKKGLENLPSEIQYHWAEIKNRYEQAEGLLLRKHSFWLRIRF